MFLSVCYIDRMSLDLRKVMVEDSLGEGPCLLPSERAVSENHLTWGRHILELNTSVIFLGMHSA